MFKLIRENLVVAIGISLPVLLVLVFLIATKAPGLWVDPPTYGLLFTTSNYDYNSRLPISLRFQVIEGHLRARMYHNKPNQYSMIPKLFRFEPKTQSVYEIAMEIPGDLENILDGTELPIKETANLTVNSNQRAPDGYEFRSNPYRRDGLVTEIFYGSQNNSRTMIVKNGHVVAIHPPQSRYYSNIEFLGWVLNK